LNSWNYEERIEVGKLKNELWNEMKNFREEKKTTRPCNFYLMCFEKDCVHYHGGIALEGRKILRKGVEKYFKEKELKERVSEKLKKEIEAMSLGLTKKIDWADCC
jgi:hypothetical protein